MLLSRRRLPEAIQMPARPQIDAAIEKRRRGKDFFAEFGRVDALATGRRQLTTESVPRWLSRYTLPSPPTGEA